jgi:hypothetical protein
LPLLGRPTSPIFMERHATIVADMPVPRRRARALS